MDHKREDVEDDEDPGDPLCAYRRVLLSDVGDQAAENHCEGTKSAKFPFRRRQEDALYSVAAINAGARMIKRLRSRVSAPVIVLLTKP